MWSYTVYAYTYNYDDIYLSFMLTVVQTTQLLMDMLTANNITARESRFESREGIKTLPENPFVSDLDHFLFSLYS